MQFNSYIFVLLFLPLSIIGYFTLNHFELNKISRLYLIVMSLWFYCVFSYKYSLILLASMFFNYLFYKLIKNNRNRTILFIAISFNILLLLYFKYFNFFIESINTLFNTNLFILEIILPMSISFYTFSQISFIVDSYKNEIEDCNIIDYSLYILYFPKMIQGPITYFNELITQFDKEENRKINWDNIAKGLYSFIFGLAKKVLVADVIAKAVDYGFSNINELDTINSLIIVVGYFIQIYFDFSGYSDMAIGTSLMFNIVLPENFNSPYKAINISDYWKRWHMSLTKFLTKYIYIPLGGNRKGQLRLIINTLIVFVISGLWHGASWNYVLWGLLNGLAIVVYKLSKKYIDKMPKIITWMFTMIFVVFGWIVFRTNSVNDAMLMMKKIFELKFIGFSPSVYNCFWLKEISVIEDMIFGRTFIGPKIYMVIYFVLCFAIMFIAKNNKDIRREFKPNILLCIISAILFVWSIVSFSGVTVFIYQGF